MLEHESTNIDTIPIYFLQFQHVKKWRGGKVNTVLWKNNSSMSILKEPSYYTWSSSIISHLRIASYLVGVTGVIEIGHVNIASHETGAHERSCNYSRQPHNMQLRGNSGQGLGAVITLATIRVPQATFNSTLPRTTTLTTTSTTTYGVYCASRPSNTRSFRYSV